MTITRIGIWGLKQAGKTVGWTAVALRGEGDGIQVSIVDRTTIDYLGPKAEKLESGSAPPQTEGPPTHLKFQVIIDGNHHDVETVDFPGEMLEVLSQDADPVNDAVMSEYKRQVRDTLVDCDGVLIFLDSTAEGTVRYRLALDMLLDEMAKRPTLRGGARRAMGVVFTKADQLLPMRPHSLLRSANLDKVLSQHPMYRTVCQRLTGRKGKINAEIFLSSSLGWSFFSVPEANKEKRKVQPWNLFAAIEWIVRESAALVEETHKQVLDELKLELKERGRDDKVWLFTNHASQLRALEEADKRFELSTGPCSARFFDLRSHVDNHKRRQLRTVLMLGVMVIGLMLWIFHSLGSKSRLAALEGLKRLADSSGDRNTKARIEERLAYYDANIAPGRWDWFWLVMKHRKEVDAQAVADREALQRILAEEAYLVWTNQDRQQKDVNRHPHRYVSAKKYLDEHGGHARSERIAVVRAVLDETRPAFDEARAIWERIKNLPTSHTEEYAQKYSAAIAYANQPDVLWGQEAVALAHATMLDWDRFEYAALLMLSQTEGTGALVALEEAGANYLRPGRHSCTMASYVKPLVRQIGEMRAGKSYTITIRRVRIPKGSALIVSTGYPNCSVTITIGWLSYETKPVKPPAEDADGGFSIEINQQLGPYWLNWGNATATVRVKTNRSFFAEPVANGSVSDDQNVMCRMNGSVFVTCRNGHFVTVVAECPEAQVTRLPPFSN